MAAKKSKRKPSAKSSDAHSGSCCSAGEKGDISITTIIIAVLALIVLVVLIAIFTGQTGKFGTGVRTAQSITCEGSLLQGHWYSPNDAQCGDQLYGVTDQSDIASHSGMVCCKPNTAGSPPTPPPGTRTI